MDINLPSNWGKLQRTIENQSKHQETKTLHRENETDIKNYATFNFTGKECLKISDKLKKIDFATLQNETKNKYDQIGVYKIECNNCEKYCRVQSFNMKKDTRNIYLHGKT